MKTTILLMCLLLIGSLFAADSWILDGDRVYWAANGYEISAYPATARGMNVVQYVNFSNTNPSSFTGNFSFVSVVYFNVSQYS